MVARSTRFLGRDGVVLGGLLLLAAAVRLPNLAQRGEFDGDQGHDVLTLLRFTRDGVFPLLGPPTSIGDFHHGAFYYLLLSPAAAVSGSNPVAVELAIALLGIAAVAVVWWLARSIAGPVAGPLAGFVAGLLMALSPSAIDESTFIWNPNPIPLFAGIALAAAWRGRTTRRAAWFVVAIASAGVVFQLHVLGIVFLPAVLALVVVEIRTAARRHDHALVRRLVGATAAGIAVVALLFLPLLIHELQNDWSETRNAIAYFTSGARTPGQLGLADRLVFTLFRVIAWPLVGLVTSAPAGAAFAVAVTLTLGIWGAMQAEGDARFALRWLLLTIAWTTVALAILAPSLQTVVAGLPNDHYHAYIDPIVDVIVGVAGALLATGGLRPTSRARAVAPGPATASEPRPSLLAVRGGLAVALVALIAVGVSQWPASTDPNGGWPLAKAAGARVVATTGMAPVELLDIPTFKTAEGIGFPIVYAGGVLADTAGAPYWVVVCDRLFEHVVGASCGGPAEDQLVGSVANKQLTGAPPLIERFDASPRTSVSIYGPPGGAATVMP